MSAVVRRLLRAGAAALVLCAWATTAAAQPKPARAACEARVLACMPRTQCPAWVKEKPSHCWVNQCTFKAYLTWGAGTTGDPLKQGDVYAASVDSPFKPDPRSENWRIIDCEVPASAQAIAALPMPKAPAPVGTVGVAPVTVPGSTSAPVPVAGGAPAQQSGPGPRELCGKRVFLALAKCMAEHCKKESFTGHADCQGYVQHDGTIAPKR